MTPDTELSLGFSCQRLQTRCSRRQPSLSPRPSEAGAQAKRHFARGGTVHCNCAAVSLDKSGSRKGSFVFFCLFFSSSSSLYFSLYKIGFLSFPPFGHVSFSSLPYLDICIYSFLSSLFLPLFFLCFLKFHLMKLVAKGWIFKAASSRFQSQPDEGSNPSFAPDKLE